MHALLSWSGSLISRISSSVQGRCPLHHVRGSSTDFQHIDSSSRLVAAHCQCSEPPSIQCNDKIIGRDTLKMIPGYTANCGAEPHERQLPAAEQVKGAPTPPPSTAEAYPGHARPGRLCCRAMMPTAVLLHSGPSLLEGVHLQCRQDRIQGGVSVQVLATRWYQYSHTIRK
jgi:hypothetical protein